jgi:S-adenosylhomocysteine hydrolase
MCPSDPLSTQDSTVAFLQAPHVLRQAGENPVTLDHQPDLIVDEGAHLLSTLHKERRDPAGSRDWAFGGNERRREHHQGDRVQKRRLVGRRELRQSALHARTSVRDEAHPGQDYLSSAGTPPTIPRSQGSG